MTRKTQRGAHDGAPQQGPVNIPDKLYFKIGEVCEITGIKQHVLRYWESEFAILSPPRARSRQRLYRRSDVENVLRIKSLLRDEGFTISGAKKLLARERGEPEAGEAPEAAGQEPAAAMVRDIKAELMALKRLLGE